MTTPQSLTEEDLRLLASLPIKAGWDEYRSEKWEALRKAQLINLVPASVLPSKEQEIWAHPNVGPMLATLQAERERERERVNGLAARLADHTQDLTLSSPGQETPLWRVYGLPDYEDGITGTTPIEAMENLAAALSPDVLGDQKDKGKATDYAPLGAAERDKESASSGSTAADEFPCDECDAPLRDMWTCNKCGTSYVADVDTCGQRQPFCDGTVSYAGRHPDCSCNTELDDLPADPKRSAHRVKGERFVVVGDGAIFDQQEAVTRFTPDGIDDDKYAAAINQLSEQEQAA